jgi:hypothetical protein
MRRALLVLTAVVLALGGTLVYFGTRGAARPKFEEHLVDRGTNSTSTTSVLLPEGTWTFGTGPAGFAVGRMHITGGPARPNGAMPDSPIAGVVEIHHAGDNAVLERVTVGNSGRFRIDLPAGDYELIGHAPNIGGEIDSAEFTISVGRTTPVDLVVSAT